MRFAPRLLSKRCHSTPRESGPAMALPRLISRVPWGFQAVRVLVRFLTFSSCNRPADFAVCVLAEVGVPIMFRCVGPPLRAHAA